MRHTTEFGKEVLKALIEKNITMKDISDALGVSQTEISYIVNGKRKSKEMCDRVREYIDSLDDNCGIDEFEKNIRLKLIDADMKVSDVAKELNVSRAATYAALTGQSGYDKIRERMLALLT